MGLMDKAKGLVEQHRGQVEDGLHKAREAVNKYAGGGVNATNPAFPPGGAPPSAVTEQDIDDGGSATSDAGPAAAGDEAG